METDSLPPSTSTPFVHLHTHTEYSLLDGASRISELVATAKNFNQPAVAITDHGVMYGAVEFYLKAKEAGIKPIIGCEAYMAPRSRHDKEGRTDRDPNHLVLLAKNLTGYKNLIQMITKAHLEGYYYRPRIDKELLAEHAEGLICLSACIGGELPQAILKGDMDAAEKVAREHMEIFGPDRYFLEIQDHKIPEEDTIREGLLEVARRTGLSIVCTNDSHYIHADDAEAHDILLCLQTGKRRSDENRFKFSGPDYYLTDGDEMQTRFARFGSEVVSNTLAIAEGIDLEIPMGKNLLPKYSPIPEGMDENSYLSHLCDVGLRARYGEDDRIKMLNERMAMELDVIQGAGFAPYFLVVSDLIRAAKCDGVRVGPGRGSAAGSLVSYCLGITNIDPIKYDLLFERFLNKERVSMPDIDMDFDDKHRDRVLTYVQEKYGRDRVAQIITFGTMAARASIRDVGRVLDIPLPDVDRLAKTVPGVPGVTLERALEDSSDFRQIYESEPWAKQVVDVAKRLEGISRNASTHAAGVVIGPEPLENMIPLQRSTGASDAAVTQYDMNMVNHVGLLKMDFLGLSNLTIIGEALDSIKRIRGIEIDIDAIPLDDKAAFEICCRGDTLGIFQMEGSGARRIFLDMQPESLEDLGVAVALNRPGPIEGGVIELYIKRKRGELPIEYLLPQLEEVLSETYGCIIYQEQVMKIAQKVAGYSLGEADILRAAMGKKDKVKMAKQREKFTAGCTDNGIDAGKAGELFDLIALFAGYGFNRSHAIAYGMISYQTAYLKANYPLEYMAAVLNSKAGDFDKLKPAVADAQSRGLLVKAPDVNRSQPGFAVGDPEQREILYGLACIKNVGEHIAQAIVEERERNGEFRSLLELCMRVESRDMNRRTLESLIRSGGCDFLGERAMLLALLDRALDRATQSKRERDSGQTALFGDFVTTVAATDGEPDELSVESTSAAPMDEKLRWERDLLGLYMSDHPLRRIEQQLREKTDTAIGEMGSHLDGVTVQVGGSIRDLRIFVPKRSTTGQRMAFMQLEDLSGSCEVVVFARTFEQCAHLLQLDANIIVRGRVDASGGRRPFDRNGAEESEPENNTSKVVAEEVLSIDDARLALWKSGRIMHLRVDQEHIAALSALKGVLEQFAGDTQVILHVSKAERTDEVVLSEEFSVDPDPRLQSQLVHLLGEGSVRIEAKRTKVEKVERRWAKKPVAAGS